MTWPHDISDSISSPLFLPLPILAKLLTISQTFFCSGSSFYLEHSLPSITIVAFFPSSSFCSNASS